MDLYLRVVLGFLTVVFVTVSGFSVYFVITGKLDKETPAKGRIAYNYGFVVIGASILFVLYMIGRAFLP